MREMLSHWLDTADNPHPTWIAVVTALRSPIVNKRYVAKQLESKYCTPAHCVMKAESNSPANAQKGEGESTYNTFLLFCDYG